MKVTGIRTRIVLPTDRSLLQFLDENVPRLRERSVLAITSKVVAILEGAVVPIEGTDKKKLIAREADQWLLPSSRSKYKTILTVKNGILAANAGIDESNANGWYVVWPKDPQKTANAARKYLMRKFRLQSLGIILTDSKTTPMVRGINGVAIAHSGFRALKDYIGTEDLFGRKMKVTQTSIREALAVSAVLLMGEGTERMPLAIIEDIPFVQFQKGNPSRSELAELRMDVRNDLYAPVLKGTRWRKGKSGK